MTVFDRSLQYQFAVNFLKVADAAPEGPFVERICRDVPEAKSIALRLREIPGGQTLGAAPDGSLVSIRSKTWGGQGVWRLLWTDQQLSLTFDARAYADIREEQPEPPSVDDVARRVTGNLASATVSLGQGVKRAFILVTGQGSGREKDPSRIVAEMYFDSERRGAAATGDVADMQAHVNWRTRWQLGREVTVNRAETAQAVWSLTGETVTKVFAANYEVNTAPEEMRTLDLDEAALASFFRQGSAFITDRLRTLEGVACQR